MSAIQNVLSGLGAVASAVFPAAAPFVSFIARVEPYVEEYYPLLREVVADGPAAFAAAKAAAPGLFSAVTDLASSIKGAPASDDEVAALAAHIAGVDPPGWTHADTVNWWARSTPDFSGGGE